MNKRFFYGGLFVLLLVIACGTKETPSAKTAQSDSLNGKQLSTVASDAPEWYVASLHDSTRLIGLGFAKSSRLPLARNKAMLEAQADLANKMNRHPDSVFTISLGKTKVLNQTRFQKGKVWQVYVRLALDSDSLDKREVN